MAYVLWFVAGVAVGAVAVLGWYALHYDFTDQRDREDY
jgi:hypothetical protein